MSRSGGNHVRTSFQSKLHRKMTDTAGAGKNKNLLPRLQARHLEQGLPGRQCRQRHPAAAIRSSSSGTIARSSALAVAYCA